MCCTEYTSFLPYVQSASSLLEKIARIEEIESKVLDAMLDQASGAGIGMSMYELDDGQVRIKTNYRSVSEITSALNMLNMVKVRYENQLYGRRITLRDRGTFRGWGTCC